MVIKLLLGYNFFIPWLQNPGGHSPNQLKMINCVIWISGVSWLTAYVNFRAWLGKKVCLTLLKFRKITKRYGLKE